MAKRKLRAWTKKDIAEIKAHSKSRTPVAKISKVMKRTVDALRRKAGIVGIRLGHHRDGRSRQKWSANRSRLIKTPDWISERPPRGGLSDSGI